MSVINQVITDKYSIYNADCIEVLKQLPDNSIDFSIYSPPYMGLYVYSNSPRDLGNCRNDDEFFAHYGFVIQEIYRVLKPGRIVAVDCMNVPSMKGRDGFIGLKDFRGQLIREHQEKGFIFHSEHCMWKDPLIEATRTKALGLLHKQLMKDSSMCRSGIPQYLLAFRKQGENKEPISHDSALAWFGDDQPESGNISHEIWRRYASPVWMDINFNNNLNYRAAREKDDERHICPMSMDITNRALQLWSNQNDVVLSPFMGIGSEGYCAIGQNRRFIGIELKDAYFNQSVKNLEDKYKEMAV